VTSGSFEENVNSASAFCVVPDGPESIVVSGAVRSTISHVRLAGGLSTSRYVLFVASTSNVCWPYGVSSVPASCAAVYVTGEVHGANSASSRRHL
jgi:hypothetical protein